MNTTDQILIDKLKHAIADLNQRLADLGSARDAIIADMLSLAETVSQLENTPHTSYQPWSFQL